MLPLGQPPLVFSDTTERAHVFIQRDPLVDSFVVADYLGESWDVEKSALDPSTARLAINLDVPLDLADVTYPDFLHATRARDWQVFTDEKLLINAWDRLLRGRRLQIRTARQDPAMDWAIFEGFIDKLSLGWSGSQKQSGRWATVYATSVACACEREPGRYAVGQWRRSRFAEIARRNGQTDPQPTNQCVYVTSLPPVFNPEGRPNCDPNPLYFPNDGGGAMGSVGTYVYIFADEDDPAAVPWTVAKMLRYCEWAAFQPYRAEAEPTLRYDYPQYSNELQGVRELQGIGVLESSWTAVKLRHLNLDDLLDPLVSLAPEAGDGTAGDNALLRAHADISIDHLAEFEQFKLLAHRAQLLFYDDFYSHPLFRSVRCQLVWSIRGERGGGRRILRGAGRSLNGGAVDGGFANGGPTPVGVDDPVDPGASRDVFLYVPSDRAIERTPLEAMTLAGDTLQIDNAHEGEATFDESAVRNEVRVQGDGIEFEGTFPLLPGWPPNPDVDVDPADPAAVAEAVAAIGTTAWRQKYDLAQQDPSSSLALRLPLRYWVLNEDGAYTAARYRRTHGPWSATTAWDAYLWRTQGNVCLLEVRGDNGWTLRRRRFRPTIATIQEVGAAKPDIVGLRVEVNFAGGVGQWFALAINFTNERDRCAIYLTVADLTSITAPEQAGVPVDNMVRAYIEGRLRVRVVANVEGDDAVVGYKAKTADSLVDLPRVSAVQRRKDIRRVLRFKPGTIATPAANSVLSAGDYADVGGFNLEGETEAQQLAERIQAESQLRHTSALVTLPWLHRDGSQPYPGYRIGDEVIGIKTGDAETVVPLTGSLAPDAPATRIAGITYRYSTVGPAEFSTTLRLEDDTYSTNDLVGKPLSEKAHESTIAELALMGEI